MYCMYIKVNAQFTAASLGCELLSQRYTYRVQKFVKGQKSEVCYQHECCTVLFQDTVLRSFQHLVGIKYFKLFFEKYLRCQHFFCSASPRAPGLSKERRTSQCCQERVRIINPANLGHQESCVCASYAYACKWHLKLFLIENCI